MFVPDIPPIALLRSANGPSWQTGGKSFVTPKAAPNDDVTGEPCVTQVFVVKAGDREAEQLLTNKLEMLTGKKVTLTPTRRNPCDIYFSVIYFVERLEKSLGLR